MKKNLNGSVHQIKNHFSKGVPIYVVTFSFLLNVVRGPRKLRALRDARVQRIRVQQKHVYILEALAGSSR